MTDDHPALIACVLDAEDGPALAAFWADFLGLSYRPHQGPDDDPGFIVIDDHNGDPKLAIQQVANLPRSTWPDDRVPAQMHLDLLVRTEEEHHRHIDRAVAAGATILDDRRGNADDPLVVMADPAGHPFCLIRPPHRND